MNPNKHYQHNLLNDSQVDRAPDPCSAARVESVPTQTARRDSHAARRLPCWPGARRHLGDSGDIHDVESSEILEESAA